MKKAKRIKVLVVTPVITYLPEGMGNIANKLREDAAIKDCLVCTLNDDSPHPQLVAHLIVRDDNDEQEGHILARLDATMKSWLPKGGKVEGYMLKHGSLKPSLVGKTDRNHYRHILEGYRLPVDGVLKEINF